MRRFVLLSLLGITILLAGSLAIVIWTTEGGPAAIVPEPAPEAAPVLPEKRPAVIVAPLQGKASEVEAFENPLPKAVPEPAAPPPPFDLARVARRSRRWYRTAAAPCNSASATRCARAASR